MQDKKPYEYVVIRLVPRVEREEFVNIGVVLYAASLKFLQVKYHLDAHKLCAFNKDINIEEIQKHLEAFERICNGSTDAGAIGRLAIGERFRWLSATRSTIVQMSKVHIGLCNNPAEKLMLLYEQLIL